MVLLMSINIMQIPTKHFTRINIGADKMLDELTVIRINMMNTNRVQVKKCAFHKIIYYICVSVSKSDREIHSNHIFPPSLSLRVKLYKD